MSSPRLFTIDFASERSRQQLDAVAAKHGAQIAAAAAIPTRIFGLISPWALQLVFVGAEAQASQGGQLFSLAGAGLTFEDAMASCLGEAIERLSQVERPGDIAHAATATTAQRNLLPQAAQLIERKMPEKRTQTVDWLAAVELNSGREVLLPADWVLRRAVEGPMRMADTALSTGVAAGRSAESAAVGAMLELVERDAVALWWTGGRRGKPLALEEPGLVEAARLMAHVRQGNRERLSWLLDITTDLRIPCVAAISVHADGTGLACGTAARTSLLEAARAAIFEMCQTELATLIVNLKRQQRGDEALNVVDRQHLARSTSLNAETCNLLHAVGKPLDHSAACSMSDVEAFIHLQTVFARQHIEVALVELTRPAYGIAVMAAVAPVLQRFPSALHTERLRTAIAATGGGAQWNGNVQLL
jgi:ribosomal protein S12 methylthiotransferase accessory factor